LLFVLFTSNMPDACSAFLIMYADDTNCFVAGDTADDAKKKLEIAALQIVAYMEENKICPNAAKTEYMLFGRRHGGEINVSGELVKESESLYHKQVNLLGTPSEES
jgi:predicted RNase H-like HicB family nuclease